jgi:hypothetical protein
MPRVAHSSPDSFHQPEEIAMFHSVRRPGGHVAVLLAVAAAAAGCASAPMPTDRLALAERAVQDAERAGAVELAPVEMRSAREKLTAAQKATSEREAEQAARFSEQAEIDGQLAEATARAEKSARAVSELEDSLRALQRETQRPTQP